MSKLATETFVTRQVAAHTLRVTPRTVDRMAEDGALETFKLGKRRSGFKLADLEAHIAKLNSKAAPGIGSPALTPTAQPTRRPD